MLKITCDGCGKEIEDPDAPDGVLKICAGIDWNSSWEEYGQFVYCAECIKTNSFLSGIVNKIRE